MKKKYLFIIIVLIAVGLLFAAFFLFNQPKSSNTCGIENCHGLEIVCGSHPVQVCTEIYELGDKCRQYAQCNLENGVCQQKENSQFTACKNCVENCSGKYKNDQIKLFECEGRCD